MAPVGFPSRGLISHALVYPLQPVPADGDTDSLPLPGACYILCHHQRRSHPGGGCSGTHRILAPPASAFKQPHESSQAPSASISASFHRQLWHFRLGCGVIRQPENRRSTRPQESLGMPLRALRPTRRTHRLSTPLVGDRDSGRWRGSEWFGARSGHIIGTNPHPRGLPWKAMHNCRSPGFPQAGALAVGFLR